MCTLIPLPLSFSSDSPLQLKLKLPGSTSTDILVKASYSGAGFNLCHRLALRAHGLSRPWRLQEKEELGRRVVFTFTISLYILSTYMLVNMFSAENSMEHSRVLIIFGPSECRWEIKKWAMNYWQITPMDNRINWAVRCQPSSELVLPHPL